MNQAVRNPIPAIATDDDELIAAVADCMMQFRADRIRISNAGPGAPDFSRPPEGLGRFDEVRAIIAIVRGYDQPPGVSP